MPSDSGERRPTATKSHPHQQVGGAPPPEQVLTCPRCDSCNTKFCYYNNYNFSQPRHFCKSCRRYWTHGGTLRDVPVGGSSRKNTPSAKRSRTTSSSPPPSTAQLAFAPFSSSGFNAGNGMNLCGGSFTSLLRSSTAALQAPAGLFGPGFADMGFGVGRRAAWAFPRIGDGGEGGFSTSTGGGDCFCLPELAVSTPGNIGLK